MAPHLVFYDGNCGFCDHSVQVLLKLDKKEIFAFAPLQGETANQLLQALPPEDKNEDTFVLVENYQSPNRKYYILGQGALRVFWLLGGIWKLIGWISWLPPFLYNWVYRLIARNRHLFFGESCTLPTENQNRFLP